MRKPASTCTHFSHPALEERINIVHCPLAEVKVDGNSPVFIVCDRNVRYVADRIGVKAKGIFETDATEQAKNLDTVIAIDRWLMGQGADRDAFVLGIGGGITTDLTGFAASIYKRGVRFGFIPTTLLSQVDAAIGGKNGVNLDSFKNMIGVIRQPEVTFICPEPLDTLPEPQLLAGAAELLKTFIIRNENGHYEETVTLLSGKKYSELGKLIAAAAEVKAGIVGRDPYEHGERRLLNLGHTFAHAIEKMSDERICHGEAVGMGMVLAARLSERLGLAGEGFAGRIEADLRSCGLRTVCPFKAGDLVGAMKKDKKAEGGIVHFVLPLDIGHVETRDLQPEEVAILLEK